MYQELNTILCLQPGAVRRKRLLAWLKAGTPEEARKILVNARHRPHLHEDRDLEVLLKKGMLVRERVGFGGGKPRVLQLNEGTSKPPVFKDGRKRSTYLVLAP